MKSKIKIKKVLIGLLLILLVLSFFIKKYLIMSFCGILLMGWCIITTLKENRISLIGKILLLIFQIDAFIEFLFSFVKDVLNIL